MQGEMGTAHRPAKENLLSRLYRWIDDDPYFFTTDDLKDIQHAMDDTITAHLDLEPRTLLLVVDQREGTTTLGPTSRDWITVTQAVRDPDHITPTGHRLTGWLATNTAKQHVDYHIAATHLTERTTP